MNRKFARIAFLFSSLFLFFSFSYAENTPAPAVKHHGIYLTQYSLENTAFLNNLIKHAKASGIDTFVVDLELIDKKYAQNIALLKENNINYVARIIMFPGGGTLEQINTPAIWQKKYRLVEQAIAWGASLNYVPISIFIPQNVTLWLWYN